VARSSEIYTADDNTASRPAARAPALVHSHIDSMAHVVRFCPAIFRGRPSSCPGFTPSRKWEGVIWVTHLTNAFV
jgi:hypothetical protein